jgi:hypothetical protein
MDDSKLRLAKRFFHPEEQDYLFGATTNEQATRFFDIWTKKESYLKYQGTGIDRDLGSFSVFQVADAAFRTQILEDAVLTYSKDGVHCTDADGDVIWNQTYEIQDIKIATCRDIVAIGNYNGNIELISGLKPKNNGNFPLLSTDLIQAKEDGTRLDTLLQELADKHADLPEVTAADAGKVLMVLNDSWGVGKVVVPNYDLKIFTIEPDDWVYAELDEEGNPIEGTETLHDTLTIAYEGFSGSKNEVINFSPAPDSVEEVQRCGIMATSVSPGQLTISRLYADQAQSITVYIQITAPQGLTYDMDQDSMTLTITEN